MAEGRSRRLSVPRCRSARGHGPWRCRLPRPATPVADESGIHFYLVFDKALKAFHYVLDETPPLGDELVPAEGMSHILVGRPESVVGGGGTI